MVDLLTERARSLTGKNVPAARNLAVDFTLSGKYASLAATAVRRTRRNVNLARGKRVLRLRGKPESRFKLFIGATVHLKCSAWRSRACAPRSLQRCATEPPALEG